MKRLFACLCVTLFGVAVIAGCSSSSDSSSTNYSHAASLGPVGADLQDLYTGWEKTVPVDAR